MSIRIATTLPADTLLFSTGELLCALAAAAKRTASYRLLDVRLAPLDHSAALGRLAERLAKRT